MCASGVLGQDKKVAVFDPAGSVDSGIKEIVREEVSSAIVNVGGYTALERQTLKTVFEEKPAPVVAEDMLIVKGRKIYQPDQKLINYIGSNATRYIDPLSKNEVQQLMANTNAFLMYNKGVERRRYGNIFILSYCASVVLIGGLLSMGDDFFEDFIEEYVWTAAYLSSPLLISGIVLKFNGNKLIRQSVEMHNRGGRASMEIDFGFTGNGVAVALRF